MGNGGRGGEGAIERAGDIVTLMPPVNDNVLPALERETRLRCRYLNKLCVYSGRQREPHCSTSSDCTVARGSRTARQVRVVPSPEGTALLDKFGLYGRQREPLVLSHYSLVLLFFYIDRHSTANRTSRRSTPSSFQRVIRWNFACCRPCQQTGRNIIKRMKGFS